MSGKHIMKLVSTNALFKLYIVFHNVFPYKGQHAKTIGTKQVLTKQYMCINMLILCWWQQVLNLRWYAVTTDGGHPK